MALVVLTGGARSGKSAVAQNLAATCPGDITVAVFAAIDADREMADRVARHRASRPDDWRTLEAADSVEWTERVGSGALIVDCMGTLLGRVMDEVYLEMYGGSSATATEVSEAFEAEVERRFAAIIGWIIRRVDDTVVVTNEVGDGIVPAYALGRVFRDVLGRANRALVERSDLAYLVVAGRCIDLSRLPIDVHWPWHSRRCE